MKHFVAERKVCTDEEDTVQETRMCWMQLIQAGCKPARGLSKFPVAEDGDAQG